MMVVLNVFFAGCVWEHDRYHGERTGGFYACNRYETAKQEGVVSWNALSATLNLTKISACMPADKCGKAW